MKVVDIFRLHLFVVFFTLVKGAIGEPLNVKVKYSEVFLGDQIPVECYASLDRHTVYGTLNWKFHLKNGTRIDALPVNDESMMNNDWIIRRSILHVNSTDINGIICMAQVQVLGDTEDEVLSSITVTDVKPIGPFDERCMNAEKLQIVLWRYGEDLDSRFWAPSDVTGTTVFLPGTVNSFRLQCLGAKPIEWSFGEYNVVKSDDRLRHKRCYDEIIEVNPISSESSRKYVCKYKEGQGEETTVSIRLPPGLPSPSSSVVRLYDNETVGAIEHLVNAIGSESLYGIGFGSSAVTFLMMLGVVILRRHLQHRAQNGRNGV